MWMRIWPGFVLVVIVLALQSGPVFAQTIGDPAHPGEFAGALNAAIRRGAKEITITPGTYDIPPSGKDAVLFDHLADLTVHAAGVTLIFNDLSGAHRPVRIRNCTNFSLEGATLRFAAPAATQGRIVLIGSDERGAFADWQIDAGFSAKLDPAKSTFNVVDQTTRLLKVRTGDFTPASVDDRGNSLFRFRFHQAMPKFEEHDWLVTRINAGTTLCHVESSTNVTIKNLTLQNSGFAGFFETDGGSNRFIGCKVVCGPRLFGATEDQLVACGADGFHSVGTRVGPEIQDCRFQGIFLDDCIAIHGTFQKVIARADHILTLDGGASQFAKNLPVRISDGHGFFEQVNCVDIKKLGGPGHQVELTLEHPLIVPLGAKANTPDRCGRGYKIIHSVLGNTRSRGILVKADDGLIDGCTIEGCGMSAISIGPEYYWNEANYCSNVTVTNNTVRQCNKQNDDHNSTLFVHGDGAIGNRNIIIRDNLFDTNFGQHLIDLNWVDGVQIISNRLLKIGTLPLAKPADAVHVTHVRHVTLSANVVQQAGPSYGRLVDSGDDAEVPAVREMR